MSGNVSYAFTLLSNLPLHAAVFCAKNNNKKKKNRHNIDFAHFIFPKIRSLKGMFLQNNKKFNFLTSALRFSIFSENGS